MPELTTDQIDAAVDSLPPCNSLELARCLWGEPSAIPNCGDIKAWYAAGAGDAMDAALAQAPFCPEDQALYDSVLETLPPCYTPELDACLNSDNQAAEPLPNCEAVNQFYDLDDVFQGGRMLDAIPICEPSSPLGSTGKYLVFGMGAIILIGGAVWLGRRK